MTSAEQAANSSDTGGLYKRLPSVGDLLLSTAFAAMLQRHSHDVVVRALRVVLTRLKEQISAGLHTSVTLNKQLAFLDAAVADELLQSSQYSLRRVINATGVVLHTNLGRSPLSQTALNHIVEVAGGYCNLELDLESGDRSRRDVHAEGLILRLLNLKSESADVQPSRRAVVVNNCAGATFLALNSIAEGAEVIVSRGELVEIGGGFRIPEILAKSGALLREIGTTNRTRLSDYEAAITPQTALILRVHQSNFSMEGFTEKPALADLVSLGNRTNIPVFDDQGTGLLTSLDEANVRDEPTLVASYSQRADLLAASGDKLLGGPQCGLLIGRPELIERIRKNPLFRAFRVDKLTYAALEATLMEHLLGRHRSIPTLNMIHASPDEILSRCSRVAAEINSTEFSVEVVSALSLIGGGTAPSARLQSSAIALRHGTLQPRDLLLALRQLDPPIIARIADDRVLLDLRTVEIHLDDSLPALLAQAPGRYIGSQQPRES
jgi:L-seryl-tRNA(Ser) seleniumtransferase